MILITSVFKRYSTWGEHNYHNKLHVSVLKTGRLVSVIRDRTVKRGLGVTYKPLQTHQPPKQTSHYVLICALELFSLDELSNVAFLFNCCSNEWFLPLENSNYGFWFLHWRCCMLTGLITMWRRWFFALWFVMSHVDLNMWWLRRRWEDGETAEWASVVVG